MNAAAFVISFWLPLCGTNGADGIAAPGVVDFSHLRLQGHSEYLLAPAGVSPKPNEAAPMFHVPPAKLFAALQDVATRQPHIYALDSEPQALQAAWVIRSAMFNFPDMVEIEVVPQTDGNSSFVFYSHAVYGAFDYGINKKHAKRWLKDLTMMVAG